MPGSSEIVPGGDRAPTPKRRKKTQLACAPCRARKTGCDGHRPHCGPCVSRGWQDKCQYPESVTGSRALTLVGIEKRLVSLEGKEDKSTSHGNVDHNIATRPWHDAASIQSPRPFTVGLTQRDESSPDEGTQFGIYSNSEFIRDVHDVANAHNATNLLSELIRRPATRQQPVPCDLKDLILPPRRLADELLQSYLELIQPMTPLLHRPTLMQQFHSLWEPASSTGQEVGFDEVVLYATMNMIFALGSQRNESFELDKRASLGAEFYERSRKLTSLETLDRYSLATVQLLLLRAIWLFYTPYAERCWSAVSVAIRAAQAIGLDSSKLIHQRTSQITREMRRRVWYVCVTLDRIASNTFARPLLLPRDTKVPEFAEIDDEHLSSDIDREGRQPENQPSRLTYNRLSLEAYKFGDKVADLRQGYSEREVSMYSAAELGTLADICQAVDDFEANLPPFLQSRADKSIQYQGLQPCFELQKRNMCARLKYLKLWILRPVLLQEVAREAQQQAASLAGAETSRDHLARDLCRLCTQTAHDVVTELYVALAGSLRTSPWHALFFTFAAGSILIAATLLVELEVDLEIGSGKVSWERVCELFRFHSQHTSSAEHGISLLEKFRASIVRSPGPHEPTTSASAMTMVGDDLFQDWQQPWDSGFEDIMSLDTSWFTSQDFIF